MTLTTKTLWQIEMLLTEPVTLDALASRRAVSTYHLARTFRAATGHAPMSYLRARRLTVAAKRLAKGESDILGLALDIQYTSHEAFTRAFTSYFGIAPRQVREAGSTQSLSLMEPIEMKKEMLVDVDAPEIRDCGPIRVAGMSLWCSFETANRIPALWQELAARAAEIAAPDNEVAFGVCCDADGKGKFRYVAGVEVSRAAALPDGFEDALVPAGRYAVFTHRDHISDLPKTVYTIWNKALSDAELSARCAPDFERYDARFNPSTGRGEVEIWIPVG